MRAVRVIVGSIFTSFRDPSTHKFQRTFPLPPLTTVKGFLGAALGLPPEVAIGLDVRAAVTAHHRQARSTADAPGKATDLWKYDKYKSGQFDTKATVRRDLLYRRDFCLYLLPGTDGPTLEGLAEAVRNPKWALSLGRDDELVRVISVDIPELQEREVNQFVDMLLPFDFREHSGRPSPGALNSFLSGGTRMLEPPLVISLPTGFAYDKKGVREITGLQPFTFVGAMPIVLPKPVGGAWDEHYERSLVFF